MFQPFNFRFESVTSTPTTSKHSLESNQLFDFKVKSGIKAGDLPGTMGNNSQDNNSKPKSTLGSQVAVAIDYDNAFPNAYTVPPAF